MPHDPRHMIDLYQNIREDDRRRHMLHGDIVISMSSMVSEGTGMGRMELSTKSPQLTQRHSATGYAGDVPFQDAV